MIFFLVHLIVSFLLDLITVTRRSERDKDIEMLLLRQHLRILQRKQPHWLRLSRWEKLTVVVLAAKLTDMTSSARTRLAQVIFLFKPETLLTGTASLCGAHGRSGRVRREAVHRSLLRSKH